MEQRVVYSATGGHGACRSKCEKVGSHFPGGKLLLRIPKLCCSHIKASAFKAEKKRRCKLKIQVLGTGCPKCNKLSELTERVAGELGLESQVEKITDINAIVTAGVMMTPALLVDGQVKVSGRIPSEQELKSFLTEAAGE